MVLSMVLSVVRVMILLIWRIQDTMARIGNLSDGAVIRDVTGVRRPDTVLRFMRCSLA